MIAALFARLALLEIDSLVAIVLSDALFSGLWSTGDDFSHPLTVAAPAVCLQNDSNKVIMNA